MNEKEFIEMIGPMAMSDMQQSGILASLQRLRHVLSLDMEAQSLLSMQIICSA